ncbi:MAG: FAD-binding oxidoreductase [Anaerolineaceae bacterium]|nr:FAD-binding oxidoreductase [Anaerolineaceae bacterium]
MKNNNYDVIIIGAGFAGCALAYQFAKARVQTLLLEGEDIGSGTSSACAGRAQIIESETIEYLNIVKRGFSMLPNLGKELDVDLEWELPGHLTLFNSPQELSAQLEKIDWLRNIGFEAEFVDPASLRKLEPYLSSENCIGAILSTEGHLNPFRFCWGYLHAAKKFGVAIKTHTKVTDFLVNKNMLIGVKANQNTYYAKVIILATGAWTGSLSRKMDIQLPISFTKAEAMVSEPLPKILDHHIGTSSFYESVHGNNKSVTLGLGQHRKGCLLISNAIQPSKRIDFLSSAWGMPAINRKMKEIFPSLNQVRIIRNWSAPSPFSEDYQPVIGWIPQLTNLYIATAFHLAIPTIPLISEIITEHILKTDNIEMEQFLSPFSPSRFFHD